MDLSLLDAFGASLPRPLLLLKQSLGFPPPPSTLVQLPPQYPPLTTAVMHEITPPDPEELGGNVTKPFKFVTGTRATSMNNSWRAQALQRKEEE